MSEQEKQENQKTIVAFAAGLLIGGLLVWVFGGTPNAEEKADEDTNATTTEEVGEDIEVSEITVNSNGSDTTPAPVMNTGTGAVELEDQTAGTIVALDSATFPNDEGWIGVRDYANGQLAGILGVARFSKEQNLIPQEVVLQRATKAGNTYAIVFYSESGDRVFSLADDVQVEGVAGTFTAL